MQVPLFTRASDRNIEDCEMRWHIDQQNLSNTNASWFAIGTALHSAYEDVLRKRPARLSTAQRWARKHLEAEIAKLGTDFLESKHRPMDGESEYLLADQLMANWWADVIESPSPLMLDVYLFDLEFVVQISPAHAAWQWEGGANTTIDYIEWAEYDLDSGYKNKFTICDWKTGRSRKSDPMQLQVYRYLLELQGYEVEDEEEWGWFYHAEHGKWQRVEEYDVDAVERLIGTSQALKRTPRPEARPSWACDYCTARSACPVWALDEMEAQVMQAEVELGISSYQWKTDPTN